MDKKHFIKNSLVGLAVGFINGLFGSGGGIICVTALKKFSRVDPKSAHATAIAVILPLSVISVIVYSLSSAVDIKATVPYILGGLCSTPLGAWLLKKIPAGTLKRIFGAVLIVVAIKMLL